MVVKGQRESLVEEGVMKKRRRMEKGQINNILLKFNDFERLKKVIKSWNVGEIDRRVFNTIPVLCKPF